VRENRCQFAGVNRNVASRYRRSFGSKGDAEVTKAALREILEELERKWVRTLQTSFAGDQLWPEIAGSDVQFFSIDFPPSPAAVREKQSTDALPVPRTPSLVVCVGINYKAFPSRLGRNGVPHISTETQSLTWVVDDPRKSRGTRRALVSALNGYLRNQSVWVKNGYASAATLLPLTETPGTPDCSIILLKTYLSPFLSAKPWAIHARSLQTAALRAWNPNQHICDLAKTIGNKIDLWVVEGTSLWPHFITSSSQVQNWILTPTLSFESQRNRSIETFWKTPRREVQPRRPSFPICDRTDSDYDSRNQAQT
jgi:hypothetical protein